MLTRATRNDGDEDPIEVDASDVCRCCSISFVRSSDDDDVMMMIIIKIIVKQI